MPSPPSPPPLSPSSADRWVLRQPYGPRFVLILLGVAVVMAISFTRVELDRGVLATGEAVGRGATFIGQAWPIRLAEVRRVERMVQLGQMRPPGAHPPADPAARARWDRMIDPGDLPLFAHIEDRPVDSGRSSSSRDSGRGSGDVEPFYVERFGYLQKCVSLMIETVEMALWGTLLSTMLALPLGFFAARNYTTGRIAYHAARAMCSLVRAVPELIVALLLVIMYGPGPVAGILALGFHASGFLGKFLADDIENAELGPQEALRATGGNRVKVLRLAVIPQVLPQFVTYIQYILERNVRTATILGIVSAGGIGFELIARFNNGEYDAVATILLIIFATVFALEQASQRLRARLIAR